MFPELDRPRRLRRHLRLAACLLLLGLGWPASAEQPEALDELRDSFRIIELRHGWALQPRDETDDYRLIEIVDGRVTVDGQDVDEEQLRRYVDEAAEQIIEIASESGRAKVEEESAPRSQPRRVRRDTQVSFATGLVVERDETVDEVVLLGGHLEVLGEIDGDATVVMGSATVEGEIDGALTVIGGGVELKSGSHIEGDVVSVGGRIRRQSGSTIDGEIIQVAVGELDFGDIDVDFGSPRGGWSGFPFWGSSGLDLVQALFVLGLLLVLISCIYFIVPRRSRSVARRLALEPWKSGLVGLAVQVVFGPLLLLVTGLLLVSIVGIPLLAVVPPLLCLLLVIFLFLGITGTSLWAGEQVGERFGMRRLGPYPLLVFGLLLIYGWTILGEVFSFAPWPIRVMAFLLLVFGFVAKYIAWTVGLGAAVLQQFAPVELSLPGD